MTPADAWVAADPIPWPTCGREACEDQIPEADAQVATPAATKEGAGIEGVQIYDDVALMGVAAPPCLIEDRIIARTFLANHVGQIMAADFFVVPIVTYRLSFVLVILAHDRRRIVHVAVTDRPTAAWTAQQLRDAFPENQAPPR